MTTKRMSKEEKRKAVLDIYHQSKQVFTEKEILALAAKAGVNSNSVAEINQSLVDDGLVDREKIGGSNYFWSFPAKKDRQTQLEHEKLLQDIERLRQQAADASVALADAKRGREEDDSHSHERATKLQRLQQLAQDKTLLQAELETLQENDPQALADLEKEFLLVQQAANRWTDNLFNAKDYLVKKRGMEKSMALKVLGITSAFDYPEDKVSSK